VTALLYIDRLAARVGLRLTEFNCHRLYVTAFVLACKFLLDDAWELKYYAKVGGVHVRELRALESMFLRHIDYNLCFTETQYQAYERTVTCTNSRQDDDGLMGAKPRNAERAPVFEDDGYDCCGGFGPQKPAAVIAAEKLQILIVQERTLRHAVEKREAAVHKTQSEVEILTNYASKLLAMQLEIAELTEVVESKPEVSTTAGSSGSVDSAGETDVEGGRVLRTRLSCDEQSDSWEEDEDTDDDW